ncbi:MAG: radical SAM protein [Candidatus Aminicenantes bacterium]|nr:radical SAM protein [Candidatus Aminicenantes bacterium]
MGHIRKQMITLMTSARCNLACVYCSQRSFPALAPGDETIDIAFAEAGMRDFFASNPSRAIRFFGAGEPTLAFEVMKEVRDRARRLAGDALRVELQSNGLFSPEVADWVERHVDILWLSYDGPPEIQDRNRPTRGGGRSSGVVGENLRRFADSDRMQAGIRATVAPSDFPRIVEIVEHFHDLGLRRACLAPVYSSTANVRGERSLGLLEFARHFVRADEAARRMGMSLSTHLIVNFDEPVTGYCRACTPCPHLTTDGWVSCCDETPLGPDYLPGILQDLIYGRWEPEAKSIRYFPEALARIRARNTDNLRRGGCSGCDLIANCSGGCLPKNMFMTGDLFTPYPEWCEAVRYLASRLPRPQGLFPFLHS